MLKGLISLTHSYEFEEYGTLNFVGLRVESNELTLSLDVEIRSEIETHEFWEVDCVGVLEHRTSLGQCDRFDLYHDHPLLWPYIYPAASVSFYGAAEDPRAVVGALYEQHFGLVSGWIPFPRFMNGNCVEMLRGRYGMLAEGPTPLMTAYAEVLESFKIGSRVTEPKPAYYTNDELSGLLEVRVVILGENSYVVAPTFNARRLRGAEI